MKPITPIIYGVIGFYIEKEQSEKKRSLHLALPLAKGTL